MTTAMNDARPTPGPAREYRFPRFERFVLDTGLTVVVAPVTKLPLVTVLALVDAGAVWDAPGQEGLAQLTARALTEGTERLDGTELTERFEQLGTALEATANWDATSAGLTVVSSRLGEALELFADVLTTPAFPEREIERLKSERLSEILQLLAEPRGLADEMFARFLYAETARFSASEGGDPRTVSALTRADAIAYYARRYRASTTTLILAGDVDVETARALVERSFGMWRSDDTTTEHSAQPDAPRHTSRRVHLVAKTDAPQSELRVGHVGVPRTHPDYFAITVMNMVLGGLFNSRINMNLREEHAYTYGAHTAFDWRRASGPFEASSAVQTDVTIPALGEILKEIDRIRDEDITPEERALAINYLDGVFPIRYETTGAIASALASMVLFGLPADYFDAYRDQLCAVSLDDIRRAAMTHLDPARLQLVVVGDAAQVRAPLEAMQVGPVSVYDVEGKPLL